MAFVPIVRYMLLCEEWEEGSDKDRRVTIVGRLRDVHVLEECAFPRHREMCVLLVLTECRSTGKGRIVCIFEETGETVFETRPKTIEVGSDPLDVVSVAFQIRDCWFPDPGLYGFQFWYDDTMVEERFLRLR